MEIKAQALDLFNICEGAVPERFEHALNDVLANISDVNRKADEKRTIVLTFEFKPYPDRSAFQVNCRCTPGLASVEAIKGIAYLVKHDGKVSAFARDIRQQSLFEEKAEAVPDGKSAAAGEKVVGIAG